MKKLRELLTVCSFLYKFKSRLLFFRWICLMFDMQEQSFWHRELTEKSLAAAPLKKLQNALWRLSLCLTRSKKSLWSLQTSQDNSANVFINRQNCRQAVLTEWSEFCYSFCRLGEELRSLLGVSISSHVFVKAKLPKMHWTASTGFLCGRIFFWMMDKNNQVL